jgi:hypothetical protein
MIEFTFEAIRDRLKDNLSKRLENSGILFYSTNQRLIEAIAEELSEEMRYNEYLTNEAKWSTAQNLSSLIAQSDFFGYTPHRKIGAKGNLSVSSSPSFNGSWPYQVNIPKFSQFYNGEYYFASYEEASLFSSNNETLVPIVQGLVRTEEFLTSTYTDIELTNHSVYIENDSVEDEILEVRVNNVVWNKVDHFGESSGKDDLIYTIKNNLDFSGITISFGDGLTSKKITSGDIISVTFIETAGELGEVLRTNNITQVISSFRDVNGTAVSLYCTNRSYVTGGREIEDIETIRQSAPLAFKTGNTLVTKQDYTAAIINTNIPDKVSVWGEAETNIDNNDPIGNFIELNENLIYVSGLVISDITGEATPIDEDQQDAIQEALLPRKCLTDIIQFVSPKITYFDVNTTVYFDKTVFTADFVRNRVSEDLLEEYKISNVSREFKENLYFSQYYSFINSIPSVSYHVTDIILFQISNFEDTSGLTYYFDIDLGHSSIRSESLKIYIRNVDDTLPTDHPYSYQNETTGGWFHIATDDGAGTFISEDIPPYDGIPNFGDTFEIAPIVPTDVFNYNTAILEGVSVGKGIPADWHDNLQLKFEFQVGTTQVDIIPKGRNQIFGINEVNIDTQGLT